MVHVNCVCMQVFPDVLLFHELGVRSANHLTNAQLATSLSTLPLVGQARPTSV